MLRVDRRDKPEATLHRDPPRGGHDGLWHHADSAKCRSTSSRSSPRRGLIIQTATNGLSAEEAESFVTVPLEQALNGVEGLEIMRSKSVPDQSSIEMLFKPGTDELRARQLVQERMQTVIPSLPTWAAPPVIMPPVSVTGRFMKIGITSEDHAAHRHVDDRVLDDPRTHHAGAGRGKCCDLGRANQAPAGASRSEAHGASTTSLSTKSWRLPPRLWTLDCSNSPKAT